MSHAPNNSEGGALKPRPNRKPSVRVGSGEGLGELRSSLADEIVECVRYDEDPADEVGAKLLYFERHVKKRARLPRAKVMAVLDRVLEQGGYKITVRAYNSILTGLGYRLGRYSPNDRNEPRHE